VDEEGNTVKWDDVGVDSITITVTRGEKDRNVRVGAMWMSDPAKPGLAKLGDREGGVTVKAFAKNRD
jgi:hypothetical protein